MLVHMAEDGSSHLTEVAEVVLWNESTGKDTALPAGDRTGGLQIKWDSDGTAVLRVTDSPGQA